MPIINCMVIKNGVTYAAKYSTIRKKVFWRHPLLSPLPGPLIPSFCFCEHPTNFEMTRRCAGPGNDIPCPFGGYFHDYHEDYQHPTRGFVKSYGVQCIDNKPYCSVCRNKKSELHAKEKRKAYRKQYIQDVKAGRLPPPSVTCGREDEVLEDSEAETESLRSKPEMTMEEYLEKRRRFEEMFGEAQLQDEDEVKVSKDEELDDYLDEELDEQLSEQPTDMHPVSDHSDSDADDESSDSDMSDYDSDSDSSIPSAASTCSSITFSDAPQSRCCLGDSGYFSDSSSTSSQGSKKRMSDDEAEGSDTRKKRYKHTNGEVEGEKENLGGEGKGYFSDTDKTSSTPTRRILKAKGRLGKSRSSSCHF